MPRSRGHDHDDHRESGALLGTLNRIVEDYSSRHDELLESDVHAVLVRIDERALSLEVRTSDSSKVDQYRTALPAVVLPSGREATLLREFTFQTTPEIRYAAEAEFASGGLPGDRDDEAWAGDPIKNEGLSDVGTAGWNFYLNDKLCCVSNWHVLHAGVEPGAACLVNGKGATLVAHSCPDPSKDNCWDYALAEYHRQGAAGAGLRKYCSWVRNQEYPLDFVTDIDPDAKYWKVGATSGCTSGTYRYTGRLFIRERKVNDRVCVRGRYFRSCLGFHLPTEDGDSGSVIVEEGTNLVAGLLFAFTPKDGTTWANPFFMAGWRKTGVRAFNRSGNLPCFSADTLVPPELPLTPPSWRNRVAGAVQ